MRTNSIFDFDNYRQYLKAYLKELPQRHGTLKKWAHHLNVHSTLVSQVMIAKRDFTEEQGLDLCDFLGHTPLEKEYFLELLRLERAGTPNLRKHHKTRLQQMKTQALKISERVQAERNLSDHESAIFYSSWIFSAVRMCGSIGEGLTVEEISEKLSIPRKNILEVIEFLRESGFVKQNGIRYTIGTQYTHLGKDSPFLVRHHNNWRLKALQRADRLLDTELMYTAPFSISENDFKKLREQLVRGIEEFLKTVKESDGELVACLNIDLFRVTDS